MAITKIKNLFYESPKPKVVQRKIEVKPEKPPIKAHIASIISEGVLFGQGPKLYGTGQSELGQAMGGGGGYAGPITPAKKGETQFGILDEEDDDMNLDKVTAEKEAEAGGEAAPADENTPAEDTSSEETPTEDKPEEEASTETPTEEEPEATPPAPVEPQETPEQKVTKMFADTGDINEDYGLKNENNIRLEKFKFVNAGIDLMKIIPEDEKKSGISSKQVLNLLTPAQRDMLRDKNRELRKQYPLIDKREKNIIIHNSNVPILNIKDGQTVEISTDMKKQAYEKINAYLEANFGKNWQDKSKAIEFLRTVKINFAQAPAIRANLIDLNSMIAEEGENYRIPLDKVNIMVPSIVQEFIKTNKEDPTFSKSNIFRTLASAYNQEAGTKGQVYVIFNADNLGEATEGSEEAPADEAPAEGEEAPAEGGEEAPIEGGEDLEGALENEVEPLPAD